jgi:hypothetical protein
VHTAPGAQVSEQLDRHRVPQSDPRSHWMLLERPTWNEQRAPSSHCKLALSPVVSMQLEFSSQSTEQEGPQLPDVVLATEENCEDTDGHRVLVNQEPVDCLIYCHMPEVRHHLGMPGSGM